MTCLSDYYSSPIAPRRTLSQGLMTPHLNERTLFFSQTILWFHKSHILSVNSAKVNVYYVISKTHRLVLYRVVPEFTAIHSLNVIQVVISAMHFKWPSKKLY